MGGIVKDAGLSISKFRKLLKMEQTQVLLTLEFAFVGATLLLWFAKRRDESRMLDVGMGVGENGYGVNRRAGRGSREADRGVPIPWGWPNCAYYRGRRDKLTTSEALQLFAETLLAERQLVFEAAANPRTAAAIPERTDDRYRPVNGHAGQLHPALQGIPEDIWFLGPAAETSAPAGRQLRIAKQGVRELRRPWGW